MLYLLHFGVRLGHVQHYLGCTTEDRLQERMREHAFGRGSKLTQRAIKAKIPIYLARVFPELSYEGEKRMKAASHFEKLCPLCCPLFEHLATDAVLINPARPENPPRRAIWDWRGPEPVDTT